MALTLKQQKWLEEYLACWNATEAARRAGFKHPNVQGPRLLVQVSISEAIKQRLKDVQMGADEALARLAQIARGDLGDFVGKNENELVEHLQSHLLKRHGRKVITTKDGTEIHEVEIELYDAQAALVQILRQHQLAEGKPTDIVEVNDARDRLARLITRHADGGGTGDDPDGDDPGGS